MSGRPTRAVPDGFAEVARALTNDALCKRFGAGVDAVRRWRRDTDAEYDRILAPKEASPADFKTIANGKSIAQMRAHYRRSFITVKRWFFEAGLPVGSDVMNGRARRDMPDDFRTTFADIPIEALMVKYGAGRDTVRRWIRETGQVRRAGKPPQPKEKAKPFVRAVPTKPRSSMLARAASNPASVSRSQRDMTRVGQAADYLRKYSGVWRCTATGSPKPDGTHWRRGSAILTDAEIIERAERLGWDADAWKRVA